MCTVTTLQEQWHFNEGRGQYVNTGKRQQNKMTTEEEYKRQQTKTTTDQKNCAHLKTSAPLYISECMEMFRNYP